MAESEFSWFKIASFFGACLLMVIAFVALASGISLITDGDCLHGVACVSGGLICIAVSVMVYRNYQNKTRNNQ